MKTIIKIFSSIIIGIIPFIGYTFADNLIISNSGSNQLLEEGNNINLIDFYKKNSLLIVNNKIFFVNNNKKIKLINNNIIEGIANKENFLLELIDDKRYLQSDTDALFIELKDTVIKLTNGLNEDEKISKIYNYILENISYSTKFDINNKEIFSGIYTFQNKVGLCGGYSKLFLYMLSFAGISNVEVITGKVIDADNFQNIGHAWVKIGDLYYDITFDDPNGISKTKNYNEYKYFGLPKDLFYVDKFDYGSLPSYLKTTNLEYRTNLINQNLSKLTIKYQDKNYLLLKPLIFRKNNSFELSEKITIKKLEKIIPTFDVNNYKYTENNKIKQILNLKYYTINDSNVEILLNQLNYDLDGYKLLKWDNGTYRLTYNILSNQLAYID